MSCAPILLCGIHYWKAVLDANVLARARRGDATQLRAAALPWTPLLLIQTLGEAMIAGQKRALFEIRVRWSKGFESNDGTPGDGGPWYVDNADNREWLGEQVKAGELIFGKGTHWIERRRA